MGRGGVKTFDALVDEVGDNSAVDGSARPAVVTPRSGMSRSVPLRDLVANPHNPRDSVGDLDELASIAEFQLQPVVVVTRAAFQNLYPDTAVSARWVVIIGNRRLAAAHKFGRPELDVVVKDELAKDPATLLTAVIAENVDRSGFDVIEEAESSRTPRRVIRQRGPRCRASAEKQDMGVSAPRTAEPGARLAGSHPQGRPRNPRGTDAGSRTARTAGGQMERRPRRQSWRRRREFTAGQW